MTEQEAINRVIKDINHVLAVRGQRLNDCDAPFEDSVLALNDVLFGAYYDNRVKMRSAIIVRERLGQWDEAPAEVVNNARALISHLAHITSPVFFE